MTIVLTQCPESAEIRSKMYKLDQVFSVEQANKLYDSCNLSARFAFDLYSVDTDTTEGQKLSKEAYAFIARPMPDARPKEITEPLEMIVEFWCNDLKAIQAFVDYLNR